MTKKSLSVVVALLILCLKPTNEIYGVRPETQSLEVVGTVVAYDQEAPLTNITWAPQSQVVLIRISKSIKGRAAGPYIKVVYRFAPNESPLPQNILDANTQWRFILKRDISCDSSVREMKTMKAQTEEGEITTIPRLIFKNETEVIADEVSLPCYVLKPGKYRMEMLRQTSLRASRRWFVFIVAPWLTNPRPSKRRCRIVMIRGKQRCFSR